MRINPKAVRVSKSAPKVLSLILKSVFSSTIVFACSTNGDFNKNISSSKTSEIETKLNNDSKPKNNEVNILVTPAPNIIKNTSDIDKINKNKDIIIGDRKMTKPDDYSTIRDFKMFNGDKGLVLLESGDILFISNNKLEKIDRLDSNNDGSMCLNSKGNGLIFYVSGNAHNDESIRNKLYINRIENYKIAERNIVIDNQINLNQKPRCSIDNNGDGLFLYSAYYIKRINNYKISDKVMNMERNEYNLIIDNDNIVSIFSDENRNGFSKNINIISKSISNETKLDYMDLRSISLSQNNSGKSSFLFQYDKGKLELVKMKSIDNIEKIKLNGNYGRYINSFAIDDNGNGLITSYFNSSDYPGSTKNNMTLIKVKNYSLDVDSTVEFTDSNFLSADVPSPYSYISIIDDKGYVFWNDASSRLNYSKIDIVDKK